MCGRYFRKTILYRIDVDYFNDLTTVSHREIVHIKENNKKWSTLNLTKILYVATLKCNKALLGEF